METKEVEQISETLRAAADAVGVALRKSAEDHSLKTFEELEDDNPSIVKMS